MPPSPLRILVLYRAYCPLGRLRAAVRSHLLFPDLWSGECNVLYFNAALGAPAWLKYYHSDVILLHTTFLGTRWLRHFPQWKKTLGWLATEPALKVAFPQDEYDHAHVLDRWLTEMGVSLVFSVFGEKERPLLYPITQRHATFCQCLTGYIDTDANPREWPPLVSRPLDVVYRASRLAYWFGHHGQIKHDIAGIVQQSADELGLTCDISTNPRDTVLGNRWFDFLGSGKAVIGCESGSSALDAEGDIQRQVRAVLARQPSASFAEVSSQLPPGWDRYRFFALSPRHLEAVATKTVQILIEGEYNGLLKPGRHYLSLKPDFSNLRDVLLQLRQPERLQMMVDTAHDEIVRSGNCSYQRFAETVFAACQAELRSRPHPVSGSRNPGMAGLVYRAAKWESRLCSSLLGTLFRVYSRFST